MENYHIELSENQTVSLDSDYFLNATDAQPSKAKTRVHLKADSIFFTINFECLDNPFVHQNHYVEHNSTMYNQEVFELFMAIGDAVPTRYLEIEINPNNALFVGFIDNTTGEKPDKCDFVSHQEAGIIHGVEKYDNAWKGFLSIPWALIGPPSKKYRLNFYRILSKTSHAQKDWECRVEECEFLCWSATKSGNSPRFHRPISFGTLKLLF